jgi:hypothetical protein
LGTDSQRKDPVKKEGKETIYELWREASEGNHFGNTLNLDI